MGTQCTAQRDSPKTRLGPSSQVLVLRTLELAWLPQPDLCYLTKMSYGYVSNIIWAVLLYGLLGNSDPNHQDKWASMWCRLHYCWLYHWFIHLHPTTKPQQSMGTLGSLLGLLRSACELQGLRPLAAGPEWNFSCSVMCVLWGFHPVAFPSSGPFLRCLLYLTVSFAGP